MSEEIINEAATATRKADALIRFFETLRFCHGEVYITPTVCWDYAVSAKNVKTYFDIVLDSLIGYRLYPFHQPRGRQSISAAHKFYLFDTGVAGHICQRTLKDMNRPEFGRAFEYFILIKLIGTRSYQEKDHAIKYWHTKSGLKVDFILGNGGVAIETKVRVRQGDLQGIWAFRE